jgi:hypothetical protein
MSATGSSPPRTLGIAVLALTAALVSGAADGSHATKNFEGSRVYAVSVGRGGINLNAGNLDNAIVIRSDDSKGEYVVTDEAGVKIDGRFPQWASLCNQVSRTRVRCSLYEPGGIRASLGSGKDSIEVHSTHHAPVVIAGAGAQTRSTYSIGWMPPALAFRATAAMTSLSAASRMTV